MYGIIAAKLKKYSPFKLAKELNTKYISLNASMYCVFP